MVACKSLCLEYPCGTDCLCVFPCVFVCVCVCVCFCEKQTVSAQEAKVKIFLHSAPYIRVLEYCKRLVWQKKFCRGAFFSGNLQILFLQPGFLFGKRLCNLRRICNFETACQHMLPIYIWIHCSIFITSWNATCIQ